MDNKQTTVNNGPSTGPPAKDEAKDGNAQDVAQFVQTLLQQVQDKFQQMSDQIINRIDEMSHRIDDLEHNLNELMQQAGVPDDNPPDLGGRMG